METVVSLVAHAHQGQAIWIGGFCRGTAVANGGQVDEPLLGTAQPGFSEGGCHHDPNLALEKAVRLKIENGIVAFLAGDTPDLDPLRERLQERLPAYMLPRAIHRIAEFPLSAHGKVDRKALRRRLEEGTQSAPGAA